MISETFSDKNLPLYQQTNLPIKEVEHKIQQIVRSQVFMNKRTMKSHITKAEKSSVWKFKEEEDIVEDRVLKVMARVMKSSKKVQKLNINCEE